MYKKDFELLARIIHGIEDVVARQMAATAFADTLARIYPRFDKERFMRACVED